MALNVAVLFVGFLVAVQSQLYDPLYKELNSRDTKNTIPVSSKGDTLNVTINLTVLKISSLSLRTGDAVLDTWIHYEWFDNRLTWEPSEYGDISDIRLPPSDVWRPDIVPFRGHADVTDAPVVLSNNGLVYYMPATSIKTRCAVSKYSSDGTVTCSLRIGSWTYSGNIMDVQIKTSEIDVSEYYHDDQWDIIEHSMRRNVNYYSCCPEPYPSIIATMTLKAKRHGLLGWSLFH